MDDEVVAVAVAAVGPVRGPLLRLVEGVMGWPVVPAVDGVLPPRCVLVDVAGARRAAWSGGPAPCDLPTVLVVDEHDEPLEVARAARGAVATLAAPVDPVALRAVVAGIATVERPPPWCTVGGASGGVGTTTVAAAIAGLRAWRHGPTLLAAPHPTHLSGAPVVAPDDLAGPAVWAAAAATPGVRDLRVVRLARAATVTAGAVPTVLDVGVVGGGRPDRPPDVLVVRPDRVGLAAVEGGGSGVVAVVGDGPLSTAVLRAVGARTALVLPRSARVAAAAAAGRLPADLPGRWLAPLGPVVTSLEQRAATGPPDGSMAGPTDAGPASPTEVPRRVVPA